MTRLSCSPATTATCWESAGCGSRWGVVVVVVVWGGCGGRGEVMEGFFKNVLRLVPGGGRWERGRQNRRFPEIPQGLCPLGTWSSASGKLNVNLGNVLTSSFSPRKHWAHSDRHQHHGRPHTGSIFSGNFPPRAHDPRSARLLPRKPFTSARPAFRSSSTPRTRPKPSMA